MVSAPSQGRTSVELCCAVQLRVCIDLDHEVTQKTEKNVRRVYEQADDTGC